MLGATWELLLDPVTFLFLIGGAVLLSWQAGPRYLASSAWFRRLAGPLKLLGLVALWLPIRAGLLMSIFLQGVLRTEYEQPLNSVYWFWSGWTHLAMLIVPVLLAWRFCPLGTAFWPERRRSLRCARPRRRLGRVASSPGRYSWPRPPRRR